MDTSNTEGVNATQNIVTKGVIQKTFGTLHDKQVYLYTLTNAKGDQVTITNYGGRVVSWVSNDKNGNRSSIVLGFNTLDEYLGAGQTYFGALIGRCCNRIANGTFKIGDTTYTLDINNGKNHLHGGVKGFHTKVWNASTINRETPALLLEYLSVDGEEGYPGNVEVNICYTLTDDNTLEIDYTARTDKATPVALTNHCYFNLTGHVHDTVYNHVLQIDADKYTPVDDTSIPTGAIKDVKGTPFDFTMPEKIGLRIDATNGGYDHNYVLNKKDTEDDEPSLAATLYDDITGRKLEVFTQEPGLQLYTGNFLDGTFKTSDGEPVNWRTALCLETQQFPDSPNQAHFPSIILEPGELYHTVTKYKLSLTH